MNFFGSGPTKKAVVRKVAVSVPTKKTTTAPSTPRTTSSPAPRSGKVAPTSRKGSRLQVPKTTSKRIVKRKASTPPPQWSNDDNDSGSDGSEVSFDSARKRVRSSASSVEPSRILADTSNRLQDDGGIYELAHAADLVSGEHSLLFLPAFVEEIATEIELQYPSASQRERFYLANPVKSDGFNSLEDISETVEVVCMNYLPEEQAKLCLNSDDGLVRRLKVAHNTRSRADYLAVIHDYNSLISARLADGTIHRELSSKHSMSRDWIQRVLNQIYSRTVSPHVETLRAYKNGTDNVYGELLTPLISEMFRETELRSEQIFVDLGSGVGNVVLQAAMEIGCESWGCEMMKNPCDLADLQAEEFPARARLWGLSVGKVHLLRGDFLENLAISDVLKRADVVLVNNQAFGPDLNSKLVDRFLDLKDGCRIVSLKSFKPDGYEIQERNVGDPRHLLRVVKKEYYSKCVSWTDAPGTYYIATKDPSELIEFQRRMEKRARR